MKIVSKISKLAFNANLETTVLHHVQPEMDESNRKSVIMYSAVATFFLGAMIILSYALESLSGYRFLYCCGFVPSVLVLYIAVRTAKDNHFMILFLMYLLMISLLLFGIFLGTVAGRNEISAVFIALLLMVPQMFTDRPFRMHLMILLSGVFFIWMVLRFKNPATWSVDITNTFIFGSVSSICSTYMMIIKAERFALVYTVRHLAETDQLTGLKNRYSYEAKMQSAAFLDVQSVYCVYVDVNGLHELNNTLGHESGDRMLQFVAAVIRDAFGNEDSYRVGGDEFIVFGINRERSEIAGIITRIKQVIEAADYHIAVGTCFQEYNEIDIPDLLKQAETRMYEDKGNYYEQSGIDRRRR